jgi:hypothetical protein
MTAPTKSWLPLNGNGRPWMVGRVATEIPA